MRRIVVACFLLVLLAGCATLEEHVAEIDTAGEIATVAAPAVTVAATPKPEVLDVPAIYKAARVIPLTSIRKVVFDRMYQSLQSTAQLTLTSEVDVTDLLAFYQKHVKHRDITLNDMLVKACAMALREHPEVNSVFEEEQIKVVEDVNIGVAVSVEGGLIVPVLRNADHKSLRQISAITKRLVERARKGELSLDEITGGTFTLSNLGMFGVEVFTPILSPPQTAILGVGRIAEKPAVVNGQIVVRKKSHLSLTIDHRIIDGAVGAQFLQTLKRHLEDPHLLVL